MLEGGVSDLLRTEAMLQSMAQLQYPAYLLSILGIWKILGVLAIWTPGRPRLKEWAYAGFAFDLSGALLSHIAVGDPIANWIAPVVMLGIGALSWRLRPSFEAQA